MSILIIVAYKPKPDKEEELEKLVMSHVDRLKSLILQLRENLLLVAADGSLVEISEWKSKEAIDAAHEPPEARKMWSEFSEVCDLYLL